jgi:hypothetical protein
MSALPPNADIAELEEHVRFVPRFFQSPCFCSTMSRDFRCADDLPKIISHGRYCQQNLHKTSVFALADSFKMVDAFAAPDSIENFNFLIQTTRWDQDCN